MSDVVFAEMSRPERAAKFWSRLKSEGDCLVWTMAINHSGYGVFRIGMNGISYTLMPHRVAWMLAHGRPLDPEEEIDHLCRNRRCAKPGHLEAVSRRENITRRFGRTLANASPVVRRTPGSVTVRRRAHGVRYLATWREYHADGSCVQRGELVATREEALEVLSRQHLTLSSTP